MIKKNSHFLFIPLLFLLSSTFAFAQGNAAKIDFGSIEGSVYSNRYFGLRLTIPDKWQIQDDETKKRIMSLGKQGIAGNNKQLEKALDASLLNTLNLLTVFRYPAGSGATFNPNFACVAEKVSQYPSMTSMDYLIGTRKLMQQSQLPYKFEQEIYSRLIGGKEFVVLPTHVTINGTVHYQNYYSAIMKGYSLTLIITYSNDEDLKPLEAMLKTIRFER